MWPLMWSAACGADGVALFGEIGLVNCRDCLAVVARAEYLARPGEDQAS